MRARFVAASCPEVFLILRSAVSVPIVTIVDFYACLVFIKSLGGPRRTWIVQHLFPY